MHSRLGLSVAGVADEIEVQTVLDDLRSRSASAVHDDLGAMPAEILGRRLADARGGPGNQGTEILEVSVLAHLSSVRLTDLSCRERVSRSSSWPARLRRPSR